MHAPVCETDAPAERIVAVVVTRHRAALLARCLKALAESHRPVDHLVVVDNGADPQTREVVEACGVEATYLPSQANLGGAGGFAYGALTALALGADRVWFADDDGMPAGRYTLGRLLQAAEDHRFDVVSPLVVDDSDPTRLAFPLRHGLGWARTVAEVGDRTVIEGLAALFNGALFTRAAFHAVGLPDLRLFVRGDEVEVHRRLARSGLRFGTATTAAYRHPSGDADWQPLLGGRLGVVVPGERGRRDLTYRNVGYLAAQPGLRWRRVPDELRYAWFHLAQHRDVEEYRRWRRLSREGRAERFRDPTRPGLGSMSNTDRPRRSALQGAGAR